MQFNLFKVLNQLFWYVGVDYGEIWVKCIIETLISLLNSLINPFSRQESDKLTILKKFVLAMDLFYAAYSDSWKRKATVKANNKI